MSKQPTDADLATALRAALAADPKAESYSTVRAARHVITRALTKPTLTPVELAAALEVLKMCESHEIEALQPLLEAKAS